MRLCLKNIERIGVPGKCCTTGKKQPEDREGPGMGKAKKHSSEQIVNLLRQIEVASANGKTRPVACREAGITEQTFYGWRKEYGGLKADQAKRLRELEQEYGCTHFCYHPTSK